MRLNSLHLKSLLLLTCTLFLFAGCRKEGSNVLNDVDDNGGYAQDASRVEWMCNDAISIADAAGTYYNGVYMRGTNTFGTCATVATDTLSSPHNLIVRFPYKNCLCLDGRNRRGTMIISYDGRYKDSLVAHTITFQDYYVNDIGLSGTIKYTRIDTTVTGRLYYNVKTDVNITTKPNEYIYWKGSLVRKWIGGYNTNDRNDDVFSISGAASLTRVNGHLFTFDIQTPLQFALNCDFCEAGVVNVNDGHRSQRQLDYSVSTGDNINGCDDAAKMTVDTHIYTVRMK